MTTVAVLAAPPRPGLVLSDLAEETPLSPEETADLYAALLRDSCRAVEDSGGELLVNFRAEDDIPEEYAGDQPSEAEVRAAVRPVLESPDDARFEVQVGSTFAGRVGNTVTHLLEEEDVKTAAAIEPTAPFLARQVIDNAAMKLRRHEVVLGPATDGRVYYAGFGDTVDFDDAYGPPTLRTLTDRGVEADLEVGFLPMQPVLETAADLVTVLSHVQARQRAGRQVPTHTAAFFEETGLDVVESDAGLELSRD
ncbi:DUF2064 domain-containing protein [Halorientalis salina]|uniref:DUF2064 domain-containing protein n=1 Tax=Halorientalis salina TaxID=2932266 RepID=UPI0010ABCA96|nr:DUF2064 domain-containing protein [Halorientalis salina]